MDGRRGVMVMYAMQALAGDAKSPTSGLQNLLEVWLSSSFICILCKPQVVCQLVHQVSLYLQSTSVDASAKILCTACESRRKEKG